MFANRYVYTSFASCKETCSTALFFVFCRYFYPCYVCRAKDIWSPGAKRKDGSVRKNYPRSSMGCKTCNVALCKTGDCWAIYHTQHQGIQQPAVVNKWK